MPFSYNPSLPKVIVVTCWRCISQRASITKKRARVNCYFSKANKSMSHFYNVCISSSEAPSIEYAKRSKVISPMARRALEKIPTSQKWAPRTTAHLDYEWIFCNRTLLRKQDYALEAGPTLPMKLKRQNSINQQYSLHLCLRNRRRLGNWSEIDDLHLLVTVPHQRPKSLIQSKQYGQQFVVKPLI